MKNPLSTQSRVRETMRTANRPIGIPQIRELIGLSGEDGYARVNRAMQDLMKAKQAERVGRGLYQYTGDRPGSDFCAKQRTMQRIMWLRSRNGSTFTARKISELAECSLWLAQRYIAFLIGQGIIRKEGQITVSTAPTPLYIGMDEHLKNDNWPVMRVQSRTQNLAECLNEMRELAQQFYAIDNLTAETIMNLRDNVSRLGELVDECEKMKSNLRQKEK